MTRLELGQVAYSAGLRMLDEIGPGLIQWAASRYSLPPPWWPALAPLSTAEREQVWAQLAAKVARAVPGAQPVASAAPTP